MTERTYNGFTNRETWLVNVFYRDEILDYSTSIESSLEFVKEDIQNRIDRFMDVPNNARSIVQELICSKEIVEKINWVELEDHYTKELEFQAERLANAISLVDKRKNFIILDFGTATNLEKQNKVRIFTT